LREILATVKENNDILRKLNLQRRFNYFYWVIKWGVIGAVAYSAYLAATPYIHQAQQTYDSAQDALNSINTLGAQAKQIQNTDQKTFTDFLKNEINKRIQP
jgi:hypothetical protein